MFPTAVKSEPPPFQGGFVLAATNRQDSKGAKKDAKLDVSLCRVTAKGKALPFFIVLTLCMGTCQGCSASRMSAETVGAHFHAKRGNDKLKEQLAQRRRDAAPEEMMQETANLSTGAFPAAHGPPIGLKHEIQALPPGIILQNVFASGPAHPVPQGLT